MFCVFPQTLCLSPFLLGLVRLVGREERHAVGPEVCVQVRGLVETPAAHFTDQVSVPFLR